MQEHGIRSQRATSSFSSAALRTSSGTVLKRSRSSYGHVVFVNQRPEGDLKVWRKNGDPWIDTKIEEGVPISQKFWNAKGELIDAESVEGIKVQDEYHEYQKLLLNM